ncbi:hypothetical protein [Ruminiclostridium cellobioparum]|uniref:Uncharacterized protein n=1 Tax=Ruminiclostridium cellobioparum subsp. termitidis CT1112 TaxID=1195236 RepID=S0FVC4_RUMCE|nr:hypothetical protein [Ruminiclostridium cellobioparum]EMS72483.1 hypothetical protein CTER_1618 [Ruminiclostridium cellobioparum subsp. termitidis CT1112]
MSNFSLADAFSINLNFIIYIRNLYLNYNSEYETSNIYPWIPINKDALLNMSDFDIKSKEIWNTIINDFSFISSDLIVIDLEYWVNKKFPFSDLFNSSTCSIEQYQNIKKAFEAWYWGSGNIVTRFFSKDIVINYYDKLINMAESESLKLKDTRIYLQVVYDKPSESWEIKNNNMIVISLNDRLPKEEEIFKIYYP